MTSKPTAPQGPPLSGGPAGQKLRSFRPNPFAGDDGSALPLTSAALALGDAGERLAAVVAALRTERVLLPVLAHEHPGTETIVVDGVERKVPASHVEHGSGDVQEDACASAAFVHVPTQDGRRALPVFSSMATMRQWNPQARPVPVESPRAAQAAATELDGVLMLDAGSETQVLIGKFAAAALGTGQEWTAPWNDRELIGHVTDLLASVPHVVGAHLAAGQGAEVRLLLAIAADNRPAAATAVAQTQQLLAADHMVGQRVDSLEIAPVAASNLADGGS